MGISGRSPELEFVDNTFANDSCDELDELVSVATATVPHPLAVKSSPTEITAAKKPTLKIRIAAKKGTLALRRNLPSHQEGDHKTRCESGRLFTRRKSGSRDWPVMIYGQPSTNLVGKKRWILVNVFMQITRNSRFE